MDRRRRRRDAILGISGVGPVRDKDARLAVVGVGIMLSLTLTNLCAGVGGGASSVLVVRGITGVGMGITVVSSMVVIGIPTTRVPVRITARAVRADPFLPTAKCSFIALEVRVNESKHITARFSAFTNAVASGTAIKAGVTVFRKSIFAISCR